MTCSLSLSLSLSLVAASAAVAEVRYVIEGGAGNKTGLNWANAYEFLEDALEELNEGPADITEIRIAGGTYTPTGPTASFLISKACTIRGGYEGDPENPESWSPGVFVTTLSGDRLDDDDGTHSAMSDNAWHLIVVELMVSGVVEIEGLTIQGGNALEDPIEGMDEVEQVREKRGGGIFVKDGFGPALKLRGCAFTGNVGAHGGAVAPEEMSLFVRDGRFEGNSVIPYCPGLCSATGNGGAIHATEVTEIVGSTFTGNVIDGAGHGGALYLGGHDVMRITNCEFRGNRVPRDLSPHHDPSQGGAIAIDRKTPLELTGCLLAANHSGLDGGALMFVGAEPPSESSIVIEDCTIVGNTAASQDAVGGLQIYGAGTVHNSILVGNIGDGVESFETQVGPTMSLSISHSCIVDLPAEYDDGNLDVDPLFRDEEGGDFRLDPSSPLINAGDKTLLPKDLTDVDDDGHTTDQDLPRSLAEIGVALDRVRHCEVDMGAYEFGTQGCPSDLSADCTVDGDDLGTLLGQWGACAGCIADLNCDEVVDGDDLGTLLGDWGDCDGAGCPGSFMARGPGPITPAALAEEFGLEGVEELAEWLAGLDFQTMSALLEGMFGG